MGFVRHDAIIVTSWDRKLLEKAARHAAKLGLDVLGPSKMVTNYISTILICPDGSKEGWEESDAYNLKREQFIRYLNRRRYSDGSTALAWVALQYSPDSYDASITAYAWEVKGNAPKQREPRRKLVTITSPAYCRNSSH